MVNISSYMYLFSLHIGKVEKTLGGNSKIEKQRMWTMEVIPEL